MSQDLRAFLKLLEERAPGELLRVSRPLKQEYEVTALVFELERRGESPAIIFEGLQGSAMPLLTNLYGSRKRLALALGVDEGELLEGWLKREELLTPPRILKEGPILEEVLLGEDADLFSLPILTHFEEDAGPYITAGVLVAKDPDTGTINGSFHRLQLKGARTLGVSLHSRRHLWNYQQRAEARGENLPVAVVLGSHPLFQLGAGLWKGDIGKDEYHVAGGFLGEPLEVVKCGTIDLEVPACAEIVIEGEILSGEREDEGPFGEFTGYASSHSTRHLMRVSGILKRRDAIYQDIVPGYSEEHCLLLRVPHECRTFRALKGTFPTLRAVSYPRSGACRFHCYISLKPLASGQARQAILAAFAEDSSLKLVVAVDEDIDVYREEEVLWAMATRMQADRDLLVMPGVMGAMLDPSSEGGLTAKLGVDATVPTSGWKAKRTSLPKEARERASGLAGELLRKLSSGKGDL